MLRAIVWGAIFRVVIFLGGNYPWEQLSGGQSSSGPRTNFPREQLALGAIVRGAIIQGAIILGAIVLGSNCPGGNHPGAIVVEPLHMYVIGYCKFKYFVYPASLFYVLHSTDICTVAIKNIKNMHAVSTNQNADILRFNDNLRYFLILSQSIFLNYS